MNCLSLCDGMSCGQIALKELGVNINKYYASEIDKNSIKVTMDNFPNTIQIGNLYNITEDFLNNIPRIDIIMFGFVCRSLSICCADRPDYNKGLDGVSGMFYKCADILNWIKNIIIQMLNFYVKM